MAKKPKYDENDPEAIKARNRVMKIIDSVNPNDLVSSIKRAPSLRGMILGYIAEEMFEKYLKTIPEISNVTKHDDHDRKSNKSDRTFDFNGRRYSIQLKSIQTNSIKMDLSTERLIASVQNDGSDARTIKLPNGNSVQTTCYKIGEYDILAVPLFPFTEKWNFAYKYNRDCRITTSKKYKDEDRKYLLSSSEPITWPLDESWTDPLLPLLDHSIGEQV